MPVTEITSSGEWRRHLTTSGAKLIVVDFTAVWCGPCKMISPKFVELSSQYPSVIFLKVDVDKNRDIATECGIKAMPTFQFYKNNTKIEEFSGADPNKLESLVKKHHDPWASSTGHVLGDAPPTASSSASAARPSQSQPQSLSIIALIIAFFQSFLYSLGLMPDPASGNPANGGRSLPASASASASASSQSGSRPAPAPTAPAPTPLATSSPSSAAKPMTPEERRQMLADAAAKRSATTENKTY